MSSATSTAEPSASTTASSFDSSPCGANLPQPTREHEWLQRFAGDWDLELEMSMGPDEPISKSRGRERARMLGGFWLLSDGENLDFPYQRQMVLGYDPQQQKYVGTWVDSMTSHLWTYTGFVDATSRILTLEAEGPTPMSPSGVSKFRDVTEFKSKDYRVLTSSIQDAEGNWNACLTIHFRRKS